METNSAEGKSGVNEATFQNTAEAKQESAQPVMGLHTQTTMKGYIKPASL